MTCQYNLFDEIYSDKIKNKDINSLSGMGTIHKIVLKTLRMYSTTKYFLIACFELK